MRARARFPATVRTATGSRYSPSTQPIAENVTKAKALLKQMAGHVVARGTLTGTYERP